MLKSTKKIVTSWLIALSIGVIFFALVFFISGSQNGYTWTLASNATFIPGVTILCLLGLSLITQAGAFDFMQYGFIKLWHYVRPKSKEEKEVGDKKATFGDAYEYSEYKKERRRMNPPTYLPYLIVGGLLTILGIIFSFIAMNGL